MSDDDCATDDETREIAVENAQMIGEYLAAHKPEMLGTLHDLVMAAHEYGRRGFPLSDLIGDA